MSTYTFQSCRLERDFEPLVELLLSTKEALHLPDRAAAEKVIERCFADGRVMGVYREALLCGVLGYFYGEPAYHFANKEILFLYVAAILPEYQQSRIFLISLLFILQQAQADGCVAFRLQAAADNLYTRKLYGRFATPLREEKSPRGVAAITFGGTIEEALGRLARFQKRFSPQNEQRCQLHSSTVS